MNFEWSNYIDAKSIRVERQQLRLILAKEFFDDFSDFETSNRALKIVQ